MDAVPPFSSGKLHRKMFEKQNKCNKNNNNKMKKKQQQQQEGERQPNKKKNNFIIENGATIWLLFWA